MKKIKAILVLSAILFLCAFVFAACGPKESGYVGMLQFGNGSWDYSDKVTFNLGKADGSKDLDSYLKKNAGIKNVRFEDYLSQDKTMSVKIKLDTDILDKTFEDEELNAFVVETKALMQNEKEWDKADVFNRAAIRYLGLSGIVMSGGVKGELYKDYYYYACKHRTTVNGHKCGYRKQWGQEKIDSAVEEVIRKLIENPKFENAIREKIGSRIDTDELEKEQEQLRKKLRQLNGAKSRLGQQMDALDISDKYYDRKYQDMEERLYKLYEDIDSIEVQIEEVETRIVNVRQQKISGDNIYQFLLYFDKLYDKFTDAEKKTFLNSFIEQVDIFEEEQPDGRILKHIKFRFPVYFNGKEIQELSWDNETTVETVVLLSHKRPDSHINVKVEFGEGEGKVPLKAIYERAEAYKPKERVTYKMIKEYIEEKYGFKVHTAYIAEVKRDLGLPMYDAPNAVEELKQPRKHPTPEKVEAIKDALKYFGVI